MEKGHVVESLSGHDKGIFHVVVKREGTFAYIADGRYRKTERPKKKSVRHLRVLNEVIPSHSLTNKKIRNVLHKYNYGETKQKSLEEDNWLV